MEKRATGGGLMLGGNFLKTEDTEPVNSLRVRTEGSCGLGAAGQHVTENLLL